MFLNIHVNASNITEIPPARPSALEPIVSDELKRSLDYMFYTLFLAIGILGVVTNIINIRVFIHQGISSDSNTIGLFTLAIFDFLSCVVELTTPACVIMYHVTSLTMYSTCVSWTYLQGHGCHLIMSRVTCWVTVYIAVERSLCVLMPFKVKQLLRPKVTTTALTLLTVAILCPYVPYFMNVRFASVFSSRFNTTLTMVRPSAQGTALHYYISIMFNSILSPIAIIIVAIATGLMIYKLMMARKWRESMKMENEGSKAVESKQSKKDLEVLKTVIMITGLFLVCMLINQIPGVVNAFVSESTTNGINKNLHRIGYYIKIIFDLINSSLNFFFYIKLSSRYRKAFNDIFGNK